MSDTNQSILPQDAHFGLTEEDYATRCAFKNEATGGICLAIEEAHVWDGGVGIYHRFQSPLEQGESPKRMRVYVVRTRDAVASHDNLFGIYATAERAEARSATIQGSWVAEVEVEGTIHKPAGVIPLHQAWSDATDACLWCGLRADLWVTMQRCAGHEYGDPLPRRCHCRIELRLKNMHDLRCQYYGSFGAEQSRSESSRTINERVASWFMATCAPEVHFTASEIKSAFLSGYFARENDGPTNGKEDFWDAEYLESLADDPKAHDTLMLRLIAQQHRVIKTAAFKDADGTIQSESPEPDPREIDATIVRALSRHRTCAYSPMGHYGPCEHFKAIRELFQAKDDLPFGHVVVGDGVWEVVAGQATRLANRREDLWDKPCTCPGDITKPPDDNCPVHFYQEPKA